MDFKDKKILITGGSRGIGLELAKAFYQQGATIIICGRNKDSLTAAQQAIGDDVVGLPVDLSDPDAPSYLAQEIHNRVGGLDILINNAAIQLNYSMFERPVNELTFDISFEFIVNLIAPINLTVEMLPLLQQSPSAAVVNIGSGLSIAPKASAAVYCASKAALRSFSRSLQYQAEVAAPNLQFMDVMLPMVETDMTSGRGSGKISAQRAATEIIGGMRHDKQEILVGRARILTLIMRFFPSLGYRMLRGS